MFESVVGPQVEFGGFADGLFEHFVIDLCQPEVVDRFRIVVHVDEFSFIISTAYFPDAHEPRVEAVVFRDLLCAGKDRSLVMEKLKEVAHLALLGDWSAMNPMMLV